MHYINLRLLTYLLTATVCSSVLHRRTMSAGSAPIYVSRSFVVPFLHCLPGVSPTSIKCHNSPALHQYHCVHSHSIATWYWPALYRALIKCTYPVSTPSHPQHGGGRSSICKCFNCSVQWPISSNILKSPISDTWYFDRSFTNYNQFNLVVRRLCGYLHVGIVIFILNYVLTNFVTRYTTIEFGILIPLTKGTFSEVQYPTPMYICWYAGLGGNMTGVIPHPSEFHFSPLPLSSSLLQ